MTRIFTEGFESGDVLSGVVSGAAASTTQKRSGAYSVNVGNNQSFQRNLATALDEIYVRFAYYTNTTGVLFKWRKGSLVNLTRLQP